MNPFSRNFLYALVAILLAWAIALMILTAPAHGASPKACGWPHRGAPPRACHVVTPTPVPAPPCRIEPWYCGG